MLFSLVTVLGSWCFADRRDSDIPTVKAFKKSHTFIYVYIATWCWQAVSCVLVPVCSSVVGPYGDKKCPVFAARN